MPSSRPSSELRVLIGLTEISGYGRNLALGLRTLAVTADFLNLSPATYGYGGDDPPTKLMALLQRVARIRARTPRAALHRKVATAGAQALLTIPVFLQALVRYDAFIFLYGSTFFGHRELALMRLLRKRVIYVFCGSDVRPTYVDGALMAPSRGMTVDECVASVRAKRKMLALVERHATAIVGHPAYAQLQKRPFVSFLEVGIPRELGESPAVKYGDAAPHVPVLVHAPTQPEAKGTDVVRTIVSRLKERGIDFVYDEVQGVTNDVLLQRLQRADLVIDMVWGDTPMAGLAADAAWFGCPTVVGGYGWAELRSLTSPEALPPTECCAPDDLEHVLEAMLADTERRRRIGRESQAFVRSRWSADVVAARFLRVLSGDAPAEWLCDPAAIRYVLGWGQPRERSREIVRAVLELKGPAGLGLADKPDAERRLLELARDAPAARATA